MTTYNLPDYSLGSYDLMLTQVLSRSVSAFTKHVQVLQHQGQLFTSAVDLGPMRRERAAKWSSFFSKLRIGVHSFTFVPFYERIPQSDVLTEVAYTTSNFSYDSFSNPSADSILVTNDSGLAVGGIEISGVTAGEVYVVSFYLEPVSGVAESAVTENLIDMRYKATSHNSTTLFNHGYATLGWNRVYLPVTTTGTAYMTMLTSSTARKLSLKLSHIKAHKVTVNEDYVNRLNMQTPQNSTSTYAFDTFATNVSGSSFNDGLEATVAVTTTGVGDRHVAFPLRNLVSASQSVNGHPLYKVEFTLTKVSGTAPSQILAAFRVTPTTVVGTPSTSFQSYTVAEGANSIFLRSGSYLDEYFVIAMDDDTTYEYDITDLQITKMSPNPEIDPRTNVSLGTFTNLGSPNDYGTFSGATTSGFTAAHDGTGADNKRAYSSLSLTSGNKYLVTFSATTNSGTISNVSVGFGTAGSLDTDPQLRLRSGQTKNAIVFIADGDDDSIWFNCLSAGTVNFTISDLVVVELPDYGTDTLSSRSTLELVGPCNQTSYMAAGDFIQLPNDQMIQLEESLNSDDQGYMFTTPFPLTRSALTAGHECEIICPEIRMMIDGNTLTTGIRQPGGIYTGMSFTATELIDQE